MQFDSLYSYPTRGCKKKSSRTPPIEISRVKLFIPDFDLLISRYLSVPATADSSSRDRLTVAAAAAAATGITRNRLDCRAVYYGDAEPRRVLVSVV